MKGISFAHKLIIRYTDITWHTAKDGSNETMSERRHTRTIESDAWHRNFECEITHSLIEDLENFQNIDDISAEEKKREQDLFHRIVEQVAQDDTPINIHDLIDLSYEYASLSSLVNDTAKILDLLKKWKQSAQIFSAFKENTNQSPNNQAANRIMNIAISDLRRLWGADIKITDTSVDAMREEFTSFAEALQTMDNESPPIGLQTEISYDMRILKSKGLQSIFQKAAGIATGKSLLLSAQLPLWRLPSRFLEIQEHLGFAPKQSPNFCIHLECIDSPETSYRISAYGNTLSSLIKALKKQRATHDPQLQDIFASQNNETHTRRDKEVSDEETKEGLKPAPRKPRYRVYIHNYGLRAPFLLKTPTYGTIEAALVSAEETFAGHLLGHQYDPKNKKIGRRPK